MGKIHAKYMGEFINSVGLIILKPEQNETQKSLHDQGCF